MPGPIHLPVRRIMGKGLLLAAIVTMLAASAARSAEVAIAEVEGSANHVTVEQGGSVTFTLETRASGWIRCGTSSTNAATASFDSRVHIGDDGAITSTGPAAVARFYAEPNGGGLCRVTWPQDPNPQPILLTLTASANAPLGDRTYWPRPELFTPSGPGDRLEDRTRTSLRLTVVEGSDTVAPSVACSGPIGALGANGWFVSAVTHTCEASDDGSGLADPGDASFMLETNGQGPVWTGSRAVADKAGNATAAGPFGAYKVDLEDPVLVVSTPSEGEAFVLGADVTPASTCHDGVSGIDRCGSSGVDTSTVGWKTYEAWATDGAGRSTTTTRAYQVVFGFSWVRNHAAQAKAGSAISIRWTLGGVTDVGSFVAAHSAPCGGGANEPAVAHGNGSPNYAEGNDSFHLAIKTDKAWKGSCRTLLVELSDGATHGFDVEFT